ncbi:PAS domain S-box protein [Pontibacter sp. 13R65]|uniref:PAS domain-containing sensor histidine kinase n=1 Tax=Pontibacter sp. 13R65 TaxID=3127458 RepID=UPI00301BCD11
MEENRNSSGLAYVMARSLDMVFTVDKAGNLVRVNESVRLTLGHSFEEWVGKPAADILHVYGVAPSSFPGSLREKAPHPVPGHVQVRGKAVQVSWSTIRDEEGGLFFCIGHTDSREQRFRSLFDNNPDMALFQDETGIILDANRSFLSFTRKEREQVLNKPLTDFLPASAAALFTEKLAKAFSGQQVDFETEVDFSNQGLRVLSVVKVPLRAGGEVLGVHTLIRDITAQRQAQRTVRQQAEKLNTIFESITDAFFMLDKDWKFTYINREFDRLLHTNRGEITGKSIWEVFPEEVDGLFHRHYYHAAQSGEAVHFEAYFAPLDLWLQVKVFPSEEGLMVYFDDITERVKAISELEKLSVVARRTTNSVIITDAQGLTEWVNEGFTRITGYTLPEMLGRKPGEILQGPETDPDTVRRVSRALKAQEPFSDEILNYRKSGEKFWFYKEVTPIFSESGELTRFIAILSDITARKEEEAQRLAMARELYRQNTDMQQFTYIVSHNLRAPVANALGLSEALLNQDRNSEQYSLSLGYLRHTIQRLDQVLRDVSEVLSIRSNDNLLEMKPTTVAEVWGQAQDDLSVPLRQCGARVEDHIEEGLLVQANQAYLHSVFHNLLSNAIKYRSSERPLLIKVEGASYAEGEAILRFSDNGSGLDLMKVRGKLFGLYQRFHRGTEGKGIGLFLIKTHIEAMGGRIEVSSEENVGTSFTIYLKKG